MAKSSGKGGLPAGFNLSVSSEDLVGKPVQVGSYLDEDPVLELIKAQRQARMEEVKAPAQEVPIAQPPKAPIIPGARQEEATAQAPRAALPQQLAPEQVAQPVTAPVNQDSLQTEAPRAKKVRPPIRRLQINLTPDSERQVNELLEIISSQSAEKNIMFSEILNALVHNLYEARADLNVSRVPLRGKWGAPTAKSFPIALAQAFKEAIITYGMKNGANQFKKVVGG
jgi:hypothetical protein